MLCSRKLMKITSTLNLVSPLTAKSRPQSKFFSATQCKTIFWEKSPMHNNIAPKLNARGQKFSGDSQSPPTPDPRIDDVITSGF